MASRIFVTGGSGFIGSNLISFLQQDEASQIYNADLIAPQTAHLKFWSRIDILEYPVLKKAIKAFQPDYVIHLAARTDLAGKSLSEYDANTRGTANVIEACLEVKCVKKVIFASSMLVCKVGHIPRADDEYSADTQYGLSKIEMERLIRRASVPWAWTIVRPTSIWGPGFKSPYRDFFETVKKGQFLDIGARYCTKTYGYIGNTIYQIIKIIFSNSTDRRTIYLGDDPPIPISDWGREIAHGYNQYRLKKIPFAIIKLAALAGDLLKAIHINFPMTSFRLKNMTTDNVVDLKELYSIAPAPPYSRSSGIQHTIEWLNNQAIDK